MKNGKILTNGRFPIRSTRIPVIGAAKAAIKYGIP